jgi:chaperonin cofactor prefoldin
LIETLEQKEESLQEEIDNLKLELEDVISDLQHEEDELKDL